MDRPLNIPFDFVLEELAPLNPVVGRMFGCFSIYLDGKLIFILRDRPTYPEDNGVWISTTAEHHASLLEELPSMRSIAMFGPEPTGSQIIPFESDDFDRDVLRACAMVRRGDLRIGKIPKRKKKPVKNKKTPPKKATSLNSKSRKPVTTSKKKVSTKI